MYFSDRVKSAPLNFLLRSCERSSWTPWFRPMVSASFNIAPLNDVLRAAAMILVIGMGWRDVDQWHNVMIAPTSRQPGKGDRIVGDALEEMFRLIESGVL